MQISFKQDAMEIKNSEDCIVTKYNIAKPHIDFALVKVSGRYPEARCVSNKVCDEIAYVQNGEGRIVVNGKEYLLHAGDAILIEAGEKFFWEGNFDLFISCSPAFNIDQHQLVD